MIVLRCIYGSHWTGWKRVGTMFIAVILRDLPILETASHSLTDSRLQVVLSASRCDGRSVKMLRFDVARRLAPMTRYYCTVNVSVVPYWTAPLMRERVGYTPCQKAHCLSYLHICIFTDIFLWRRPLVLYLEVFCPRTESGNCRCYNPSVFEMRQVHIDVLVVSTLTL